MEEDNNLNDDVNDQTNDIILDLSITNRHDSSVAAYHYNHGLELIQVLK